MLHKNQKQQLCRSRFELFDPSKPLCAAEQCCLTSNYSLQGPWGQFRDRKRPLHLLRISNGQRRYQFVCTTARSPQQNCNVQQGQVGCGVSSFGYQNQLHLINKMNVLQGNFLNNRFLMERGSASTPKMEYQVLSCIFHQSLAMATLGLKEMGKFLWEGREKGGKREGQGLKIKKQQSEALTNSTIWACERNEWK